jgi:5-methylcytosine-specific restriction protein B
MSARSVEAIFAVYFGTAAYKATYGRFSGSTYTKDYIQLSRSGGFPAALDRLFPLGRVGDTKTAIEYRWPGGSEQGFIERISGDRPHLAWPFSAAPAPWKLAPSPSAVGPETIAGDPGLADSVAADDQLRTMKAGSTRAYLVAVKLRGEANVLHVRAYLENPSPGAEFANVSQLPGSVRDLVLSVTDNKAFDWALFDSRNALLQSDVAAALESLEENPSLLLIGPPGTGKTVLLDKLVRYVESPATELSFDPEKNHDAWDETAPSTPPGLSRTVVFHPSYSYDNLVVGLLPAPVKGGGVVVKAAPGPLVNLAHYAASSGNRALLVLDEFNRGNAAAILGDALALLDKDKRGNAFIDLPYADLDIVVPAEFAAKQAKVAPRFTLPPNLWIVAAMNSSDRSVAPLDAALRRRFTIKEMGPNYEALSEQLGADDQADLTDLVDDWTLPHVGKLAVELLKSLNRRIDAVMGPDFRLGQSNFWNVSGSTPHEALRALAAAFDYRIVQTLRLALQDDDGSLAAVLLAGASNAPAGSPDSVAWWKKGDAALGSYAADRIHIRSLSAHIDEMDKVAAELRRQAS